MILADGSRNDFHVVFRAYPAQIVLCVFGYFSFQYLVPIFGDPSNVHLNQEGGMATSSIFIGHA